jgi:hypothetical protein
VGCVQPKIVRCAINGCSMCVTDTRTTNAHTSFQMRWVEGRKGDYTGEDRHLAEEGWQCAETDNLSDDSRGGSDPEEIKQCTSSSPLCNTTVSVLEDE